MKPQIFLCLLLFVVAQAQAQRTFVPDSSFGTNGYTISPLGDGEEGAQSFRLQPDGKLVVGGFSNNSNNLNRYALVRYLPDGNLDPAFAVNGKAILELGPANSGGHNEAVRGVAIQPDGKIVTAGNIGYTQSNTTFLLLARHLPNGDLDSTFGTNGVVLSTGNNNAFALSVVLLPDGKILTGGSFYNFANTNNSWDMQVRRYLANGVLDSTFGVQGSALIHRNTDELITLALQTDGKILLAGISGSGSNYDVLTARLHADGRIDSTFAADGISLIALDTRIDVPRQIQQLPDGKVLIVGNYRNNATGRFDLFMIRLEANGQPDPTFGNSGVVKYNLGNGTNGLYAALQEADGSYLGAGYDYKDDAYRTTLFHFLADGSLDSGFGDGGAVIFEIAEESEAKAMELTADGDVIIAGYAVTNGNYDFLVAQFKDTTLTSTSITKLLLPDLKLYPNPIAAVATLSLTLDRPLTMDIQLLDPQGREIHRFDPETLTQGSHELLLHFPEHLTQGVYFLHLITPEGSTTLKIRK